MVAFDTVVCEGVSRVFGRTRALSRVDLTLRAGEVTALLGPNGAGKSTLVSVLSTYLAPTAGSVRFGPIPHHRAPPELRRLIGLVSHSAMAYPHLSALENLDFAGRIFGVRHRMERSRELLARVGLDEEAWSRPAREYSRGMLQRLSVARSLLHEPRLLLLDEPFSGLDSQAARVVAGVIADARKRGCIVLLVTHDLAMAARVADRAAIIRGGRIDGVHQPLPCEQDLISLCEGRPDSRRARRAVPPGGEALDREEPSSR